MHRFHLLRWTACAVLAAGLLVSLAVGEKEEVRLPNRPKVAGKLSLTLRERRETAPGSGTFKVGERTVQWNVAETAIIVCDMWDDHWCKMAAQRVGVMAPKMNEVLSAARSRGVMIVHAPSDTMNMYADTSYRKRMQQAAPAKSPVPIARWCKLDPSKEPEMPVDTTKCSSDDPVLGAEVRKWNRQHPGLDVVGYDGVSDSGEEIFNFCEQEGIKNIAIMGVHTNMCVLGRSFGIRQMVRLGRNVVVVRDLTDCMYDPRQRPYVSHARGTELVIEHIEKYWCPSIVGQDLREVVSGSDGPGKDAPAEGK